MHLSTLAVSVTLLEGQWFFLFSLQAYKCLTNLLSMNARSTVMRRNLVMQAFQILQGTVVHVTSDANYALPLSLSSPSLPPFLPPSLPPSTL